MQIDLLDTFLDLAETRSFHRTAERLRITQSTVSARVTALESQLASLTGQGEENSYKIKQLEAAFERYKTEMEGRTAPTATPPAVTPTGTAPRSSRTPPRG